MKTRQGFVSNSSSSSFILGLRGEATVTLSLTVDASKYGTLIETKKELDDYTLGEYGWKHATVEELLQDESYLKERYEEALAHIEGGEKVLWGTVHTDSDDELEVLLCNRGFPEGNYVIIQQAER